MNLFCKAVETAESAGLGLSKKIASRQHYERNVVFWEMKMVVENVCSHAARRAF